MKMKIKQELMGIRGRGCEHYFGVAINRITWVNGAVII
jgi:hypothetical protein